MSVDWHSVSPQQFEELCFHLLECLGFTNLKWHGEAGSDRGRDIVCDRIETLVPGTTNVARCVVQCKRYSKGPSRKDLEDAITWARAHNPRYFWIITTGIASSNTKDWLELVQGQYGFSIMLLERPQLETLVRSHFESLRQYMPSETAVTLSRLPSVSDTKQLGLDKLGFPSVTVVQPFPLKSRISQNLLIPAQSNIGEDVYGLEIAIGHVCQIKGSVYGRRKVTVGRDSEVSGSVVSLVQVDAEQMKSSNVCAPQVILRGACKVDGLVASKECVSIPDSCEMGAIYCANDDVQVGSNCVIGDIVSPSKVTLGNHCKVTGIIQAGEIDIAENCEINALDITGPLMIPNGSKINLVKCHQSIEVLGNVQTDIMSIDGDVKTHGELKASEITAAKHNSQWKVQYRENLCS